jgi:hypothetical protein
MPPVLPEAFFLIQSVIKKMETNGKTIHILPTEFLYYCSACTLRIRRSIFNVTQRKYVNSKHPKNVFGPIIVVNGPEKKEK